MNVPKDLLYTKDHEWARLEGKAAHIGITDYAQHSLGDITFIELPKKGQELIQAKFCATVESVKAASDIFAPFSGKVISTNDAVVADPASVNNCPYEKGYLFVMEIKDEKEKSNLMDAAAYTKYLEGLTK